MNIFAKYTIRSLRKNKSRSLVTIISIVLAVIMMTIVLETFISVQHYFVKLAEQNEGSWHGVVYSINDDKLSDLKKDSKVEGVTTVQNLGYSKLENPTNLVMPYLYVGAIKSNTDKTLPVKLISGRLPKNSTEIILPKNLPNLADYAIGDKVDLTLGLRMSDDMAMWQTMLYGYDNEELKELETRKYVVVGTYEKPSFEPVTASGYTALTVSDENGYDSFDAYISFVSPSQTDSYISKNYAEYQTDYNDNYLMYIGCSTSMQERIGIIAILASVIIILSLFSAFMIYNSFAISVRERTKHFGILKSIGATKKQIKKTVLYEGLFFALISIPIGLLVGTAVFSTVLSYADGLIKAIIKADTNAVLTPYFSVLAFIFIIAFSLVTIMISVIIPANRAKKISPIDAIRQKFDFSIPKHTAKKGIKRPGVLGIQGTLVRKNFIRSRKKYLSAIFSILISIMLFITGNSIASFIQQEVEAFVNTYEYDLMFYLDDGYIAGDEKLFQALLKADSVTDGNYQKESWVVHAKIPVNSLKDNFDEFMHKMHDGQGLSNNAKDNDYRLLSCEVAFINDSSFIEYAEKLGLDVKMYLDSDKPLAIALDEQYYDSYDDKSYVYSMLKGDLFSTLMVTGKDIDGYYLSGAEVGNDKEAKNDIVINFHYYSDGDFRSSEELVLPYEESAYEFNVDVGHISTDRGGMPKFIFPMSVMKSVLGDEVTIKRTEFYFKADNHAKAYDSMKEMIQQLGLDDDPLFDIAASNETERAVAALIKLVVNVFIILLAAMAAANIFNTVSNDFMLRRREFAVLKSVGLSKKGIYKMTILECILYSFTGLVIGIPLAIGTSYIIYRFALEKSVGFEIPIVTTIISIVGVILILLSSMAYSMLKIKNDNTVDAMKNENI